jgi:hypothetical protein
MTSQKFIKCHNNYHPIKDVLKSVLRISSAHNKEGTADINIAEIVHLSNFFKLEHGVYIHLQA